MNKTITVKGIGKASASPDYVILYLGLKAQDKKYDQAMAQAAEQIQHLKDSLFQIGFERDAVKTTDFDVDTEYENEKDGFGNYTKLYINLLYNCCRKIAIKVCSIRSFSPNAQCLRSIFVHFIH